MDAEALARSPFSPARHARKESKGTRARKSQSRARRRRQRSETNRTESSDDKRRRRRSPSHARRERGADRERSDVPEGRERRTSSMKDAKSPVQAAEPVTDPERPPCEHCGQPLTKHLSGRKQHQWMSIPCLTYQFFNQMTKEEQDQEGAWARAQRDAKGVHKKRLEEGGRAPHPARRAPTREEWPEAGRHVSMGAGPSRDDRRSRTPPKRRRRERSPVLLREAEPEWDEVPVESEPVRPVRRATSSRHMPPPEPPSPPRGWSAPPPRVGEAAPEDGGSKTPKQLTINITL